jgi:hypothetical protein
MKCHQGEIVQKYPCQHGFCQACSQGKCCFCTKIGKVDQAIHNSSIPCKSTLFAVKFSKNNKSNNIKQDCRSEYNEECSADDIWCKKCKLESM